MPAIVNIGIGAVKSLAAIHLAKRLNGEDPRNDCSPWERRAIAGMEVFRDTIHDTIHSVLAGHMTASDAMEIIDGCGRGIDAYMFLNHEPGFEGNRP